VIESSVFMKLPTVEHFCESSQSTLDDRSSSCGHLFSVTVMSAVVCEAAYKLWLGSKVEYITCLLHVTNAQT